MTTPPTPTPTAQRLAFDARDVQRLAYAVALVRKIHDAGRPGAGAVLAWLEALQDEATP